MKILLPLLASLALYAISACAQPSKAAIDMQKKIAAATPAALPQSPTDDRLRTDAHDANLKAKVKIITSRVKEHSEPGYPQKMLTAEDFYNEAGNRVRSIDWDGIHPIGVGVYGYIDKMRVSRRGIVEYADCGNAAKQSCPPVMHTLPTREGHTRKRDSRYDMLWTYKHDPRGRLTEEVHLNNDGEILTRTTYTYETDVRRVVRHYAAGTEPLALVLEIIDPVHSNIVEEWLYDEDKKVNAIRYYTYKFDARGNWVEQKVTERTPSDKQARLTSTTHRSITYYE